MSLSVKKGADQVIQRYPKLQARPLSLTFVNVGLDQCQFGGCAKCRINVLLVGFEAHGRGPDGTRSSLPAASQEDDAGNEMTKVA
jgi:hypothetical protein